jgi:hypothetical protein
MSALEIAVGLSAVDVDGTIISRVLTNLVCLCSGQCGSNPADQDQLGVLGFETSKI